jgi:CDP-diacylglycerol--glycerol-3-phosphate 3-phosphatidyltransferase
MLSRKYKSSFGDFVRPLSLRLYNRGIKAAHLTAGGLLFSALAALAYGAGRFIPGGILLLLAGAGDALDGTVARTSGEVTPFGSFIDSVVDRYSELLVFGGLAVYYRNTPTLYLVLFSLAGSLMVSYTRAKSEAVDGQCEVGIMERPERIILLIVASLFNFMVAALWILAVLTNMTALHRVYHTYKNTRP